MQLRTFTLLTVAVAAVPLAAQTPPPPTPQEKAPVDWKDLTSTGVPIRFYGFFRLDTYYNTARMDSVVLPMRVLAENENGVAAKTNDDQFDMDPRLTRFGIDVTPSKVGDARVTGKLEIDFANFPAGVAESRATPRIRLAYMDVTQDELGLRVGQDWDVVSPLFPSVDAETLLWNAGNTGDRRPQIQGRWVQKDDSKDGHFEAKVALGLTGAISNQDLDTPAAERDGFDSGMPHGQARAAWRPQGEKSCEVGLWGLLGQIQTDTSFGGNTRFETWLGGVDFTVPVCSGLTWKGEAWTGKNLGDVRGGVGQTINTTTGQGIGATGGWSELIWQAEDKLRFHVGGSVDDPDNSDLASGNAKRNWTTYTGTVKEWSTGIRTGLDVIYWETDYVSLGIGNTVRFDLWFQFNF